MLDVNISYLQNIYKKSLSICLISDDFLPAMTGVGVHLKLIAPELVRLGHQVSIITSRRKGEPEIEKWEGVTIFRVFTIKVFGFYQAIPSAKKVRKIIQLAKPDLIHHHYFGLMMKTVCKVAESLNIRQISTYHFGAEVLTQPILMRPFRGLIKKLMVNYQNRFDLIMTPSRNVANKIYKEGVNSHIRYVTNPVVFKDTSTIIPAERTQDFSILYAGRLGHEKNIEYLLRSFALFLVKKPDAILWIAGRGPQLSILENLCSQLNIKEKVKFLGFLDHPTLAKYYAACDVFVLPSLQEVQPLVVMEAMWFAKPVIVTSSIAAAEELVEQGVNGFIVDPHSAEDLSDRLLMLSNSSSLRESQSKVSRQRANEYRPDTVVKTIENIYDELLEISAMQMKRNPPYVHLSEEMVSYS